MFQVPRKNKYYKIMIKRANATMKAKVFDINTEHFVHQWSFYFESNPQIGILFGFTL